LRFFAFEIHFRKTIELAREGRVSVALAEKAPLVLKIRMIPGRRALPPQWG
jgi:hypothetical protein